MSRIRSYTELAQLNTFEERFDYLSLKAQVGKQTFGFERYMNQRFYRSRQWKQARDFVIARDEACDLGVPGFEIFDKIIIHHIRPMTPEQIEDGDPSILDPENLISVTLRTHNAIHFGDKSFLSDKIPVERTPGDTTLW